MLENAGIIVVLPLAAFLMISFLTRHNKGLSAGISILAVGTSLAMSLWVLFLELANPGIHQLPFVGLPETWLSVGSLKLGIGVLVDPLASVMLVVVTLVSFLVQIYSTAYMGGDAGYSRYFAFMSLFTFSMLGLVVANNYLEMYIFWELVGLCSYLLIGFWYSKKSAADAAKKAFVVTRFGDFGFLLGLLLLFTNLGTFNFLEIQNAIGAGMLSATTLTIAAVLVFFGAVGKSAQFPLHVWLPDAMEGPTPVSALIHAATMVAAGVYLVARTYGLFAATAEALTVVAYIGGFTAIFAASIAVAQNDIKRIVAYSTISQLGYMMMALGVGGFSAGVFHLMTHAFFKALLFLAAGSVIFSFFHEQDIWKMGGLGKYMKITATTMIIGALANAGLFPLSGFWSKDEILLAAKESGHLGLYWVGVITALLTAFYMFRLVFVVFFGPESSLLKGDTPAHGHGAGHAPEHGHGHAGTVKESPAAITAPLMVLALLTVFVGFWGSPWVEKGFSRFVNFGGEHGEAVLDPSVAFTSTGMVILGILFAWLLYGFRKDNRRDALAGLLGPVYTVLQNKYYFDELYLWLVHITVDATAKVLGWFDLYVVGGLVNGVGALTKGLGASFRRAQSGAVQTYALIFLVAVVIMFLVFMFSETTFTTTFTAALAGGAR